MRMGVDLGGRTVGCPAGVGNAHVGAMEQLGRQLGVRLVAKPGDFPWGLGDHHAILIKDGDTSGVVTPVFEPPQAIDQHGGRIRFSNVSDDSAHGKIKSG